ncbi:malto-oligosyltrehalose trehalohydrolase [Lacisediminihabitans sp. G11-30]|uniref:Malto-oligosyltrehalose trehalohydrolase n=2 Tax=Lacisediminihabitans changchengi TaxID=2787634 RepID=A0A934W313_9MICO|nr:malto-oligosyltrehalose trehalohydrolase [Lacisediminihabitans changchengi]
MTLLLDGERHAMVRLDAGWWGADAGLSGESYGFLIDGDEHPLPDPRSRRQPESVHGLSRTFDASEFAWSDQKWTGRQLAGGMIYELHIGTFTKKGTLDSAIKRLDHLVSIGVDFVEVLPVNGFNGDHNWGYDGVLWYTVDESYGGPEAYQRFVDACHERGLGVIQDVVYNHLGPSGNYLPRFGPYLRQGSANTWGDSINLDAPEVRAYIVENALMWLSDYHVDGLRLDAVHALIDESPVHILQELSVRVDALSAFQQRPLTLIAESDLNDTTLVTPREGGGYGLQAQWSDDFHHALHVALTGETSGYYADFEHLESLAKVITRGFYHDGTYSSFREKDHGHPVDTSSMPAWRLVVANQNHDQIGNRAIGDRLSAQLDSGKLAIAAVLTLAGPFTPMLFMGEEWGASTPWQFFTAHPEPELGEATAQGRIAEFAKMGWDADVVPDPQDPATFENSKLKWSESAEGSHAELLSLYQRLGELRRTVPDLTDPSFGHSTVEFDDDEGWFVLRRGATTIVVNFADYPLSLPIGGTLLLGTADSVGASSSAVVLPRHSAAILSTPPLT